MKYETSYDNKDGVTYCLSEVSKDIIYPRVENSEKCRIPIYPIMLQRQVQYVQEVLEGVDHVLLHVPAPGRVPGPSLGVVPDVQGKSQALFFNPN